MNGLIVFSCLIAVALAGVAEPPEVRRLRLNPLFPTGRIVGGVDTDIRSIPHQVALEYQDFHFCGGSIISDRFILTAAHCLITSASNINVRMGTSRRMAEGVVIGVAKSYRHAKYNDRVLDYDVALLELSKPITQSDKIRPIRIVDSEPTDSEILLISGWGMTKEEGECSPTLKSVDIPIMSRQKCQQSYSQFKLNITDRMICAYALGKDSCQGDSGGPAVTRGGKLAGIVSWGVGCARPNFPGVYTNIIQPEIKSFISQIAKI